VLYTIEARVADNMLTLCGHHKNRAALSFRGHRPAKLHAIATQTSPFFCEAAICLSRTRATLRPNPNQESETPILQVNDLVDVFTQWQSQQIFQRRG
jgi:hypothetical protein